MPKIAYSESEREHIREALITTGLELFAKQGIQHTTVEKIYTRVGISRTFFYTFFPTKGDLIVQAFHWQRPKIVERARKIMEESNMDWREGIGRFLRDCCFAVEGRFAIMTVEEQQVIFSQLSEENYKVLREEQIQFFSDLLETFGILVEEEDVKFLWNFIFSVIVIRKAIPETLPFLYPDVADEMVEFQIHTLIGYIETLQEK